MLKRYFLGIAVLLMALAVQAQQEENEPLRDPNNNYLVWTAHATVVEGGEFSDSLAIATELGRSTSFFDRYFPYRGVCDWTPGMRFMVLPEKRDMVIRTFADNKTKKMVGNMALRHRIFEYQGFDDGKMHDKMLFRDVESGVVYYYEVPTRNFEDFCFSKKGVPALAYLGDVDSAAVHLVGKKLVTNYNQYNVDLTTTSYGYDKVPVNKGTVVTVKAVGVGTRNYPVKLIVEDRNGYQFFQNVLISGTNSGMTEEELADEDEKKHVFDVSFRLVDEKERQSKSDKYEEYIGKKVVTLHATTMINENRVEEDIPRLTEFRITDVTSIIDTPYSILKLETVDKTFTKKITFERRTSLTEDAVKGIRDDYFGTLFRVGSLDMAGVRAANLSHIRQGVVLAGFTEEEVLLALGEPDAHGKSSKGSAYTWVYMSLINREQCIVYFDKKTRRVTAVRQ